MTEEEINLAYEGYLRRMETQANLIQIAVKNVLQNNLQLIRLTKDLGYSIGTIEERNQLFQKLNIEEEQFNGV